MLPNNRDLLIGAGVVAAGVVVLWLIARDAKGAGKGAARVVGDVTAGAVIGVGEWFGLPDTTDPRVLAEGRAAFEAGRYFEASQKLPLPEYFALVRSYWSNRFTAAPDDNSDATGGAGHVTNGDEGAAQLNGISPFLFSGA